MVQKLVNLVYDATDCDVEISTEEASLLLEFIERLGMQPPNYTKMPDTWIRSTGEYGIEVAEWESELESK